MLGRVLLLIYMVGLAFYGEQIKDDIINLHRSSVVMLTIIGHTHGGTGFFVKAPSGKVYTMTNGHVCRLAEYGTIIADDGETMTPLEVVAMYEDNDLCILDAPEGAKPLRVANSTRNLENVYVIGHPLLEPKTLVKGQLSGSMTISVLQGVDMKDCKGKTYKEVPLVGLEQFLYGGRMACVRTTEATIATTFILPGNSGSPVLDIYGHVVGVVYAGQEATGRGMIVPLHDIKTFLKDR